MQIKCQKRCNLKSVCNMQNTDRSIFCISVINMHSRANFADDDHDSKIKENCNMKQICKKYAYNCNRRLGNLTRNTMGFKLQYAEYALPTQPEAALASLLSSPRRIMMAALGAAILVFPGSHNINEGWPCQSIMIIIRHLLHDGVPYKQNTSPPVRWRLLGESYAAWQRRSHGDLDSDDASSSSSWSRYSL